MLTLGYGTARIPIQLSPGLQADTITYEGSEIPVIPEESRRAREDNIVRNSLRHPISSDPLSVLAKGKQNAVILISDMTRLCPSYVFLPAILDELNSAGMKDSQVQIIVALGAHRKQTEQELVQLVGETVFERVKVMNHSFLGADCVLVGTSSRGTPIEINKHVVDADLRIVTGNIEPHGLVGMSGGVKALVPGTASVRCIQTNHSLSQTYQVAPGDVVNPVHQDLEEAAQFMPVHFLLNVIVNHRREIIDAAAGHIKEAYLAGVEISKKRFLVPVSKLYDVVIASTGGFPKDIQLYQAVKTLQNAAKITKPGGSIVLLARCQEMFGNGIFQYWVDTIQDQAAIAQMLQQEFVLGAHKIDHIHKVLQQHQVYLYSDLPESTVESLGFQPVPNLQAVIHKLISHSNVHAAVMPYGALTFPQTSSSQ